MLIDHHKLITLFVSLDSWEEPQDLSAKFGCSVSVGEHSFAQMEDDVDRQKLLGQPSHQRVGQPVTDLDHLTLQVQVNMRLTIYAVDKISYHADQCSKSKSKVYENSFDPSSRSKMIFFVRRRKIASFKVCNARLSSPDYAFYLLI